MDGVRTLIVDGDPLVRSSVERFLQARGCIVSCAESVSTAQAALDREPFDVAIIERLLPDGDGTGLCARERPRGVAMSFVVLSSLATPQDVLDGYRASVDLYLRKPMGGRELAAHVAALVRTKRTQLRMGPLLLDSRGERLVFPDGTAARLSRHEALLLERLATSLGRTVHRDALVGAIWGDEPPETNAIDVLAFRVRRKLGAHARMLKTIRGTGLRVQVDEAG